MNNFFIGLIGGVLLALVLICVACIQMWPKWKAWGFVRATNDEEFKKIESHQEEYKRKVSGYFWIGGFTYAGYTILTWFIDEDNLGGAALGFTIFFIPGYFCVCLFLDYLTRKKIIKF